MGRTDTNGGVMTHRDYLRKYDYDEIVQLYKDGLSYNEIASAIGADWGYTQQLIYRLRKQGLIGYRKPQRRHTYGTHRQRMRQKVRERQRYEAYWFEKPFSAPLCRIIVQRCNEWLEDYENTTQNLVTLVQKGRSAQTAARIQVSPDEAMEI